VFPSKDVLWPNVPLPVEGHIPLASSAWLWGLALGGGDEISCAAGTFRLTLFGKLVCQDQEGCD
jgi:hypothetical protein